MVTFWPASIQKKANMLYLNLIQVMPFSKGKVLPDWRKLPEVEDKQLLFILIKRFPVLD